MFAKRSQPSRWVLVSVLLHLALLLGLRARSPELDDTPHFTLPDTVEFGITQASLGAEGAAAAATSAAPTPAEPKAPPKTRAPKQRAAKAVAESGAVTVVTDAGAPADRDESEAPAGATNPAAVSGLFESGAGTGLGGDGSGSGVGGATIALNVDLERVRNSALLLETQALLDIIPEWQALLAGSGLEPVRDFRRVFVAAPSLDRAALVVSAEHALPRARIGSAVDALAAERGSPAPFHSDSGIPIAAWRNRGPTERVIALPVQSQLLITRGSDLDKVLAVSRALGIARKTQGFESEELAARGGLLAMQTDEAVALWVEGLRRYVRNGPGGIPDAARLSIFRVDQFHTDLALTGTYNSKAEAATALAAMDGLRAELSEHPRVIFLGLKSAVDSARIEQLGNMLRLKVRLTLHQTRYLLGFVRRVLRPTS